jgi:[ribosomal protein S18]-alanine N-acetyltransferase
VIREPAPADRVGTVDDGVVITGMRRRHLRGVVAIEQQTNHRPWSYGLFLGELRMPTSRSYVVAMDRHHVIGFAGLMVIAGEGHVTNVAVHPDHWRRHVATRMMLIQFREAVRLGIEDLTLEVRMSNTPAQELYRRFGFAPGGIRPNYYSDLKEDALIMWAHGIDSEAGRQRLDRIEEDLPVALVDEVTGRAR